ncbi:MAG TPA: prolyl oligopeptidase family serine peptidase [Ktedonobacteraceae bacterium]|nr:prolyl oligopeptidase family serine peptidase [Ktedonobacteraceae bacterium]
MNRLTTRRDNVVEDYHGTSIADPYRWLEDARSEETRAWAQAQSSQTRQYLDTIDGREKLQQRFTDLWNYPKYSVIHKEGDRYFFSKNSGLQNQSVLYMAETLEGPPRPVLDPNTLSADGTVALTNQSFSKDGSLLAYGTSSGGSDWQEIRILNIDKSVYFDEVIYWSKFTTIAWQRDNQGFYYSRFPEPGSVPVEDQANFNKVYWHQVGTPQSEDRLIFERPDAKELGFFPTMSYDGQYLLLEVWHGTDPKNCIYYRKEGSDQPFVRLLDKADAHYDFIDNDGTTFYFHTTLDAPHGRIIAIDIAHPEPANWRVLVPEQEDVIAEVERVNHQFVVQYMHDASHRLRLYNTDGSFAREIELPAPGSIMEMSGKPDDTELFINFTSYLYPPSIYRYDFSSDTLSLLYGSEIKFSADNYQTTQVFYTSKDGTRVPMFLTHRKDLPLDGNNPTLLYGYGGFNISLTPSFSIPPLLWIENGGIYAVANLRGGNEYGEEWHQAGMLEKKQNVFDDFIAAAEWLIANKYTNTTRLAINGRSNGGLLVAACMVQRPDLYGAVVCGVPVIDMLRYHRFTVGRYWVSEYGDAEHNPEHFKFLYAYSPLHNVKEGVEYPATLILTADTDDRVVPAHAMKFAATLQAAQKGSNPILLWVEMKAGHGMGKPTSKVIEEECDTMAFLCKVFGVSV